MTVRAPSVRAHALLSLATLGTFARAVPYPLALSWDDGRFIADNPDVQEVSWRSLRSIFGAPHFQAYHPLHLLSYWLDVPWAGADGPALHAVNLALWVIAANLLLRALYQLGCSPFGALVGTCVVVLHPAQVEAVSWATGRKDVLAMLFACACLLCHLRASRWSDRYAWFARGAYALAVLSKTTALPLPAVLVLLDLALRRRSFKQAVGHQLPSLVVAVGIGLGVVALWNQEQMIQSATAGAGSWLGRVAATFGHQLVTALWPSSNSPMYSTKALASTSALAVAACGGLLLAGWLAKRRDARLGWLSIGSFVLLMLPVCNAIPMYFPYQDRYLSLPLVGLGLGLGALLDSLHEKAPRLAFAFGVALCSGLALRSVQYEGEWRSELRLWGHAVRVQPDAYYAWMKLGEVRRRAGELPGAIRAYQQLLRIDPLRKIGHAALFQAAALRDEKLRKIAPSRAELYAKDYYEALLDPEALRALAGRLLERGYVRTAELPAGSALLLQPFPDNALEHAAAAQFAQGRPGLGLLYLRHMRQPTRRSELLVLAQRAQEQLRGAPIL